MDNSKVSTFVLLLWVTLLKNLTLAVAPGANVTFPWSYTLDPSDQRTSTVWEYSAISPVSPVQVMGKGPDDDIPAIVLAPYIGRVVETCPTIDECSDLYGNAGMILFNVSSSDAGIYYVTVRFKTASALTLTTTITVDNDFNQTMAVMTDGRFFLNDTAYDFDVSLQDKIGPYSTSVTIDLALTGIALSSITMTPFVEETPGTPIVCHEYHCTLSDITNVYKSLSMKIDFSDGTTFTFDREIQMITTTMSTTPTTPPTTNSATTIPTNSTSTTQPTSSVTSSEESSTEPPKDGGLGAGVIAGIAVGCTAGVAAIATGIAVPLTKRRKKNKSKSDGQSHVVSGSAHPPGGKPAVNQHYEPGSNSVQDSGNHYGGSKGPNSTAPNKASKSLKSTAAEGKAFDNLTYTDHCEPKPDYDMDSQYVDNHRPTSNVDLRM